LKTLSPMEIAAMFDARHIKTAGFLTHVLTITVIATGFLSVGVMAAQFTTAPVQLSMSGVSISNFGWATALSVNGQVAIVGGGGCQSTAAPSGAFIYTRNIGAWGNPVQLSETGVPSNNSFGCAVALSANGQVALVGSSLSNSAYVYTETNGTWSAPVPLSLSGITPSEYGYAVALSPDGKTALVGDIGANSSAGAVYVYTYNGSTWSTGNSLTPSGLSSALYGYSIAVSSNGSTGLVALIGATEIGKVYVSTYNGSWSTPTAISTLGISNLSGSFGASVALSANGQSAVVGSPFESGGVGAAYVYTGTGTAGSFGNPTALSFPANTTVRGYSVAMAPNGQEVFAGAPLGSTSGTSMGSVNAYTYNGSSWSSPVTLSTAGLQSQGGAGWSLAEGASGQELVVGAPFANANQGLGYFYESPAAVTAAVTPNPSQVAPGKNVELDISFTNADMAGSGLPAVNLTGLVLTDTLPTGSTYVSSNPANGNCSHTSTTVTCTLAALNAGTNSQNPWQPSITITTPSAAGNITNSLSVLADEPLSGTSSLTTPITNDVTPTVTSGNLTTPAGTAVSGSLQATPGFSGQVLTFTIVTQPSHGSVTLTSASTGAFTYTPASGYTGNDTFIFTAGDGTLTSAPGSETIAVGTGGSTSSGKSGGGAFGILTLIMLGLLMPAMLLRKMGPFADMKRDARFWSNRFLTASCAVLAAVFSTPAFAAVLSSAPVQLSDYGMQQGQLLGWSLGLSADGQVAAGGAPAYNRAGTSNTDYTGAAYVYVRIGGTWSAPITLSTTGIPTGSFTGGTIAVSPSGQQVIVGATGATSQGGVYVYTETGGSWTNTPTRTALALPTNIVGADFGEGLAVSSSGQTLLVGTGPATGTSSSEIYAYSLSSSTWSNPVALPMTGIPNGLDVGRVLAISANGEVVVAGGPQWNGPNGDTAKGAAYVWTQNSNGSWNNPVQLAYPSTLDSSLSFFGGAVALSSDGTEILVGATGANNSVGAAYVYTDTNGTWSSTPTMLSTTMSNVNSFGNSVALSPDGQTAFMGMPVNDTGYVFLSTKTNGTWSTPTTLSLANLPVSAFLGIALAQGDDGEELLTTGYEVNNDTGALFVYDSPAAVTLATSPSATSVAPGSSLTFNLTLTNTDQPGSTPATTLNDVVLTDILPAGTIYVSSNAANGSCNHAGGTVTCTLASLVPGNNSQNPWSPSITVTTPSSASVLTNTLNVSSNEPLTGTTSVTTDVTNDVVPTAINGGVATSPGQAVPGALTVTPGYSGQNLTFVIQGQPTHGTVALTNAATGAFTYTPAAGFTGTDVFIFNADDGVVTSNAAAETVTVSTTQVVPPVANNQTLTGVEGYVLNGQLSATSSNGHALTYAATGLPAHGSLNVTNSTGAFNYTPAAGFSGNDSFTFTANDGTSTSNTATVSITVLAASSGSGGGSSSSGKSGGGGMALETLLLLGSLLALTKRKGLRP
jgi:uncharacterized repeat protein (TIGR01451 family)